MARAEHRCGPARSGRYWPDRAGHARPWLTAHRHTTAGAQGTVAVYEPNPVQTTCSQSYHLRHHHQGRFRAAVTPRRRGWWWVIVVPGLAGLPELPISRSRLAYGTPGALCRVGAGVLR